MILSRSIKEAHQLIAALFCRIRQERAQERPAGLRSPQTTPLQQRKQNLRRSGWRRKRGSCPGAVPPEILFPLLEGASFEENEDLHTMWAALLANAAKQGSNELVRPSFMDLLRIMTPDVAVLLNAAYDEAVRKINSKTVSPMDTLGIELEDLEDQFEPDLIAAITAVTRADLGSYNHLFLLYQKVGLHFAASGNRCC